MPRGPKKHLKRLNAPRHWNLGKMGGVWAPKPSPGPHKQRECLPVAIILRERLKYALTGKECQQICMERCVKIDGKVRTDMNYPAGFMDIVEISGYFKKRDWVLGLYGFPVRFNGVSRVVLGVSVGPFCLQVGIERPNEEYDSCYRQPRYLVWQ